MSTRALELKQKIHEQKDVVTGMFTFEMHAGLVESAGARGLIDFIIIELEHSPYYADKALELIRAAECVGVVPIVRIPDASGPIIQKVLDIGAKGIMLPMVRSAAELRSAVASTRYQPTGTRGAAPSVRGAGKFSYLTMSPQAYAAKVKELDEEMLVFTLPLETRAALDELEEIISTPGLDCASLSVVDIGHALGHVGELDHPEIREVQRRCADLCKKHNVPTYTCPIRPGQFEYWYERGVRVFAPVDTMLFEYGIGEFTKEWQRFRRR